MQTFGSTTPVSTLASATPGNRRRLGAVGFANWAHELDIPEEETDEFFDTITVCVITGSTQTGIIVGFAEIGDAGGRQRRVIGNDASATLDKTID